MTEQRLPTVNNDNGTWGGILNQFISKEHHNTGSDDAANGGHQHITLRAGTTAVGTAPIKLASGALTTIPEEGAIEYLNGVPYMTVTVNSVVTRKAVLITDAASAATGDIFYLASNGELVRLTAGLPGQVLGIQSGVPVWTTASGIVRSINTVSTTTAGASGATDYIYYVSGTTTITLPSATSNVNRYTMTNTGVNVVTITATSSQTINGSMSATLPIPGMSLDFISNGNNWIIQ